MFIFTISQLNELEEDFEFTAIEDAASSIIELRAQLSWAEDVNRDSLLFAIERAENLLQELLKDMQS